MTKEARRLLVIGLRNAHGVESQATEILERQASALDEYPDLQSKIQEHLGVTERQLERLEQCLKMLGENSSAIKDTALSALGNFMALANTMAGDAVIKNSFASYSFEHYEMAAYKSLMELAELTGEARMQPLLQESFNEEKEMAEWLLDNIRPVTREYIRRREQKAEAA
jgi:ferritin-like metal-binding protein YciE